MLLARPVAAMSLALLLQTCPITPPANAPDPPSITPRLVRAPTGGPVEIVPRQIVGGFLYPVSGAAGVFEVDSPLFTTNTNTKYYSMTVHYTVQGLATLQLEWRKGDGTVVPVPITDGPCDAALVRAVRARAVGESGRDVPIAFDVAPEFELRASRPVAFITCSETDIDEITVGNGATVHTNVAILLPASLIEPAGSGTLSARARFVTGGPSSEPTSITIRQAPVTFAVAGDSVAWGQGNTTAAKFTTLLAARVPGSRLIMKAHSGAVLRSGNSTTIRGVPLVGTGGECDTNRGVPGEVPRPSPSVQCQLRDLSTQRCQVTSERIPRFFCDGAPVPSDAPTRPIDLDAGPRIDFAVVNGCINDLGTTSLFLTGYRNLLGITNRGDLRSDVASKCDLRNAISDVRDVLPNARIGLFTYHFVGSTASDPTTTGCFATIPSPVPAAGFPVALIVALTTGPARQDVQNRSADFQSSSVSAYSTSLPALNGNPGFGRGVVLLANMSGIFPPATAQSAPGTLLWNLSCAGGAAFGPVDPVAGARASACTAFFNPTGATPNSVNEETCLRASAFHPDAAAQPRMFGVLNTALAPVTNAVR